FVIANMFTWPLPPKTGFRFASALIMRRFFLSCRPCFLMYAQSFLVTSVRGNGFGPTTTARSGLGVIGFMKAAFGFRAAFFFFLTVFLAMRSPLRRRVRASHGRVPRNQPGGSPFGGGSREARPPRPRRSPAAG